MIRPIYWLGGLDVEGKEDVELMLDAFRNGRTIEVDGRKLIVVSCQLPSFGPGEPNVRVDVEEVLPKQ